MTNTLYNDENALCKAHRESLGVPDAYPAVEWDDLGDEDPISCDACAVVAMRNLGAI